AYVLGSYLSLEQSQKLLLPFKNPLGFISARAERLQAFNFARKRAPAVFYNCDKPSHRNPLL
ncbi:hypothetical protein, partial [Pseudomonas aeruginosa]|uniref:hypothetical protein n=1 Tax=Pseudomonas aeruginosa TaxID=287 RepID=UPI001CD97E6B